MNIEYSKILASLSLLASIRNKTFEPSPATAEDLEFYFSSNEIYLPEELKTWLMICNGTSIVYGGLFGINQDKNFREIKDHYHDSSWKTNKWIPIASDQCGDYYVLDCSVKIDRQHPIYFMDQADFTKPDYVVASNLRAFLNFIINDEIYFEKDEDYYWPFNKDLVIQADPDIVHCKTAPLPWDED